MTREERNDAIEFFKNVAEKEVNNAKYSKLAIEALEQEPCEKDTIKFYHVESLDDYWIGKRLDTMFYAEWSFKLKDFVWTYSKYLPWGEHVVAPNTLWKEHTYPSEPKEIPFTEWIRGFLKKYCGDAVDRQAVLNYIRDNYRRWFNNDDAFMQCVNGIKDIVPVTPQQKM